MGSGTAASQTSEGQQALQDLLQSFGREQPGAVERGAALALQWHAEGAQVAAAAAAGLVVLTEHLESAGYVHTMRMLGLLATVEPLVTELGEAGLLAWAGAAIAHDYGVLPSWPPAPVAVMLVRAQKARPDVALALACALGEICERNGDAAEFAAVQAQAGVHELQPDASPLWRGRWAIVAAWHLCAFARVDEAANALAHAQSLAAQHGLQRLAVQAALQRARLIEWRRDPEAAVELARRAVEAGDPARTPLWFADLADVQCSAALRSFDFHAAVGHARRAIGHLQLAAVWPGYQVTYHVNEAYALIGTGAAERAAERLQALTQLPLPRYLTARLRCLAELASLIACGQQGPPVPLPRERLAGAMHMLRELEWPSALHLLPQHIARLFARALDSGVEVEWVRAAIRTRRLAAPRGASPSWPWPVKLRAFGPFEWETDDVGAGLRAGDARKAASKPLDLLRLLATLGHGAAAADTVAETLWPGDGREGRHRALEVTIARLRRLLGYDEAVVVLDHRVGLNPDWVWVDVQDFADRLAACEAAEAGAKVFWDGLDAALALYRGPCLAQVSAPFALAAAARWRARLAAVLLRARAAATNSDARASAGRLRALAADPSIAPLLSG